MGAQACISKAHDLGNESKIHASIAVAMDSQYLTLTPTAVPSIPGYRSRATTVHRSNISMGVKDQQQRPPQSRTLIVLWVPWLWQWLHWHDPTVWRLAQRIPQASSSSLVRRSGVYSVTCDWRGQQSSLITQPQYSSCNLVAPLNGKERSQLSNYFDSSVIVRSPPNMIALQSAMTLRSQDMFNI